MKYNPQFILVTLLIALMPIPCSLEAKMKKQQKVEQPPQMLQFPAPKPHVLQHYDFDSVLVGFSANQIDQHKKLYENYVNKWNKIEQDLTTADRTHNGNITYSPFRALKVGQTFARNATLLHELYFENLGRKSTIGKHTRELLEKNFGSLEAFKQDLFESCLCARGWVLTCYTIDAKTVTNFVLDAHHESLPVLTIPLLVVDVYEHAYMIDFGIHRKEYLTTLWNNIDWDVVEKRVVEWIHKLK